MEKNHYKLERREKALLDYWNIEAKKGNKNAIDVLDFHTYLITRESRLVGICRRTTIISRLRYVEKFFEKPYRKTDETGMLEALKGIENATLKSNGKPRSPNTVKTEKLVLRKFFAWLEYGDNLIEKKRTDGYPRIVRLINSNFTKEEKFRMRKTEDDILTKLEVQQMIQYAPTIRDKALISFLYETGCRVGELVNVTLRDIKFTARAGEVKVTLFGKTGHRDNIIKYYSKYLIPYINTHPFNSDKDRALFLTNNGKDISPKCVSAIIKRVATMCGMSKYVKQKYISGKRVYPHLFRHTSASHKASEGWTDSIIKYWHGWSPSSSMLSTYSHISGNDAIQYVREQFSEEEKIKQWIECSSASCSAVNESSDLSCWYCKESLNKAKQESMVEMTEMEELQKNMLEMFKQYAIAKSGSSNIQLKSGSANILREIIALQTA
jgi:integrase/recombinase XerD